MEKLDKLVKIKRNEKGQILPGQKSLNPEGRPKGLTIKERIRLYLKEHPDAEDKIVEHFVKNNRELLWQMLEGKPSQGIGQAADLEPLVFVNYGDTQQLPT